MTVRAFDLNNLPPRLTTEEVCRLAHCSVTTLWRKRRDDPSWLPAAPVQLSKATMFDREAVLKALGLIKDAPANDQWTVDPNAIRAARSRKVRHASAAQGRDVSRPNGSAGKASALRVVGRDPASR